MFKKIVFTEYVNVFRFGRRIPYCTYMLMVGVCSFIILGLPSEYSIAIRVLAIIGRSVVSSEFGNIYLITSELYPTVVRYAIIVIIESKTLGA